MSIVSAVFIWLCASCDTIDDERVPDMPVSINLSTPDFWTTYGVTGYGEWRMFVRSLGEPRNFPYGANAATGYGGVLLISGFDPYPADGSTSGAVGPMAYDLSCPVECKPDIRVKVTITDLMPEAVCSDCGSHYDITERAGAPIDGPALSRKLGLKRYICLPTQYGGYIITN